MTDQSVAERLRACGPWVQALLRQMLPMATGASLPAGLRFVVIDASTLHAPGATGTDYRLHIAMDLRTLQFLEVLVSDGHTGETSSTSRSVLAMSPWRIAAMRMPKACVKR